jgi:hypothetical protein
MGKPNFSDEFSRTGRMEDDRCLENAYRWDQFANWRLARIRMSAPS